MLSHRLFAAGLMATVVAFAAACGGEESSDSCVASQCVTPPPNLCDGDTAIRFLPFGSCVDGACDYSPTTQDCEFGCADGACMDEPDPCDDVTCDDPPAATCDENTVVGYAEDGTCSDGDCEYEVVETDCRTGEVCSEGACVEAPDHCTDGTLNRDETDVDCGGARCPGCGEGLDCLGDEDCASGVCDDGTCAAASCSDGTANGAETDRDCGGPDCTPCRDGRVCEMARDCASGVCGDDDTCAAAACDDDVLNGAETDVDCGGGCDPCALGETCADDADCESGTCLDEICTAASCADDTINGDETDVDCGGETCAACPNESLCLEGADCRSGRCESGVCRAPACFDGEQGGRETDVDCGGPCEPCGEGESCRRDADCDTDYCNGGTCAVASCDDRTTNGDESDVDCGGAECDPCANGGICRASGDCESLVCDDERCQAPSCDDGVQNGDESDVDCGGTRCDPCDAGLACRAPADCMSLNCADAVCAAATCDDGILNGTETDLDCGGSCLACPVLTCDPDDPFSCAAECVAAEGFIPIGEETPGVWTIVGETGALALPNSTASSLQPPCMDGADTSGSEFGYLFVAPETGTYTVTTDGWDEEPENLADTWLYAVLAGCRVSYDDIDLGDACNDDASAGTSLSTIEIDLSEGDAVFFIVDGASFDENGRNYGLWVELLDEV